MIVDSAVYVGARPSEDGRPGSLRGLRERCRRTMVSVRQNEQVQKISAWAAILVIPTILAGIYGMNFRYMPQIHWSLGYPAALILMLAISLLVYVGFRRSGWL